MAGKFKQKPFSEINIYDPFFESLKSDYPGSANSTGFSEWFQKKADAGDTALVYEDEDGVGAFVKLKKEENESIELDDGTQIPTALRLKISTIKIDERFQNRRIGEGAIGLALWEWQDSGINEIYVTVFEKHRSLISLLEKFGFIYRGNNLNGERIYIKDRRQIDFSDPCLSFPFISNDFQNAGVIAIDMEYHDNMFAYSELANTIQESLNISVANGLKKVYIGSPTSLGFKINDPVFIYRKFTGEKGKGYKSCITSLCVVTRIEQIKHKGRFLVDRENYLKMIGNKSVFPMEKLEKEYRKCKELTLIEMVYYNYFGAGNNVNWIWLKNNGCWPAGHPLSFRLNHDQFVKILRQGKIDAKNVIIN